MKRNKFPPFTAEQLLALSKRDTDIRSNSPRRKVDYHHGILSKAVARGLPESEKAKLNDPKNIILIDHEAHLAHPPSIEEACRILFKIYGRESVLEWFNSVAFKVRPFQLPEEEHPNGDLDRWANEGGK